MDELQIVYVADVDSVSVAPGKQDYEEVNPDDLEPGDYEDELGDLVERLNEE